LALVGDRSQADAAFTADSHTSPTGRECVGRLPSRMPSRRLAAKARCRSAARIPRQGSSAHNPVKLVHGSRTERVAHFQPVEGDPDRTVGHRPVVGDVSEVEAFDGDVLLSM
jgi:hypothetical protein